MAKCSTCRKYEVANPTELLIAYPGDPGQKSELICACSKTGTIYVQWIT